MKQLLFFSCCIFFSIYLQAQPKHEIRAVWLTTNYALDWPSKPIKSQEDIAKQKEELCNILDKLKAANFNLVFFQTRIRGNVVYPSQIEPWSSYINGKTNVYPGYDPLAFVIEACHNRGLECHAWFVTYPLGLEKIRGKNNSSPTIAKQKNLTKTLHGEIYLDPGNPATNDYLLTLVKEIVQKYDIDGFHFDYIRYPDKAALFPDQATYNKFGKNKQIESWRRENINKFVYSAYDNIKALKPWVQVSSSVLGMYKRIPESPRAGWTGYECVFQDPADWLIKGKQDFIVPMMYYTDDLFFPFIHNWVKNSNNRFILPGIGVYRLDENEGNWDTQTIIDQISYSRENHTQGNVYYRTQYLLENKKGILDQLTSRFYQFPATLPPLLWLDSIAPPKLSFPPQAIQEGPEMNLSWENSTESSQEKIYYNIYRSEQIPVDTENPANLVATNLFENKYVIPVNPEVESGYYYVVTANDRFHNESETSGPVYFCTGKFEK